MPEKFIHVKLLNKQFDLPKDILLYMDEHHQFENLRQELLLYMMENCADPINSSFSEQSVYKKFRHYADLVVKKMILHGVYDVTVDDLIGEEPAKYTWKCCMDATTNAGIKLFYKSLCDVLLARTDALLEQATSLLSQATQAEQRRSSEITGTGLGIISNDIIGFGVWAAMENRELKRQAAKADAEFQKTMDRVIENGEAEYEKKVAEGKSAWIENVRNSVNLFILSLYDEYINVLIAKGKFSEDALNYIDMKKATSILQNLNKAADKQGLVEAAFLSCPFCAEVYVAALPFGKIEDTVKCARAFEVDDNLKVYAEQKCNTLLSYCACSQDEAIKKISLYVEMISCLCDNSSDAVIVDLLQRRVIQKEKILSHIANNIISSPNAKLKQRASSYLHIELESIIESNEDELRECIKSSLSKQISADTDIQCLYDEILDKYTERIVLPIKEYIHQLKTVYADIQECTAEKERIDRQIAEYESIKGSLSLLSFAKKKELQERIHVLKKKRSELDFAIYEAQHKYDEQ